MTDLAVRLGPLLVGLVLFFALLNTAAVMGGVLLLGLVALIGAGIAPSVLRDRRTGMAGVLSLLLRGLRFAAAWLWAYRREKSGCGRVDPPRTRYGGV